MVAPLLTLSVFKLRAHAPSIGPPLLYLEYIHTTARIQGLHAHSHSTLAPQAFPDTCASGMNLLKTPLSRTEIRSSLDHAACERSSLMTLQTSKAASDVGLLGACNRQLRTYPSSKYYRPFSRALSMHYLYPITEKPSKPAVALTFICRALLDQSDTGQRRSLSRTICQAWPQYAIIISLKFWSIGALTGRDSPETLQRLRHQSAMTLKAVEMFRNNGTILRGSSRTRRTQDPSRYSLILHTYHQQTAVNHVISLPILFAYCTGPSKTKDPASTNLQ